MCLPKSNRYDKQLVNAQRYSLLDWWNKESLIWKTYEIFFNGKIYRSTSERICLESPNSSNKLGLCKLVCGIIIILNC